MSERDELINYFMFRWADYKTIEGEVFWDKVVDVLIDREQRLLDEIAEPLTRWDGERHVQEAIAIIQRHREGV